MKMLNKYYLASLIVMGVLIGCTTNYYKTPPSTDNTTEPTQKFLENEPNWVNTTEPTQKFLENEPNWVNSLIKEQMDGPVARSSATLSKCVYKGEIVYYLPQRCCDFPSILWSKGGKVICHPGGGLSGMGDGKCPDFFKDFEERKCEIIWKDPRSNK